MRYYIYKQKEMYYAVRRYCVDKLTERLRLLISS